MTMDVPFNSTTFPYTTAGKRPSGKSRLLFPEKQIFGIIGFGPPARSAWPSPRGRSSGSIGPANSGKTTLLKCINRTLEFTPAARISGKVMVAGRDVAGFRNVYECAAAWAWSFRCRWACRFRLRERGLCPRRAGIHNRGEFDALVEQYLRQAMLWDEVSDRLDMLGTRLSGGQQQRLTLARALSPRPEILCLDEFSIAIDPVTTMKIEDVLLELKEQMTIVLVTNLVQQARRLADRTAFLSDGGLIEEGETEMIFTQPANRLTERYVNGEFG